MYKVFIKEYPIILTDSKINLNDYVMIPFGDFDFKKLLTSFNENRLRGIYLYHSDLQWMWKEFQSKFKVIEAAGGLVKNENEEVLMIYRFDKWDLPKGKIENGETKEIAAIREVTEETGVKNLEIIRSLPTTFHLYTDSKVKYILKISYWFEMKTTHHELLIPQIEEGIEIVGFLNFQQLNDALKNTYNNIKILLEV